MESNSPTVTRGIGEAMRALNVAANDAMRFNDHRANALFALAGQAELLMRAQSHNNLISEAAE